MIFCIKKWNIPQKKTHSLNWTPKLTKKVAENADLKAHVTHLETTLEMQQQPIQYDRHQRPPDRGRRRGNRNRRGAFGHY